MRINKNDGKELSLHAYFDSMLDRKPEFYGENGIDEEYIKIIDAYI